MSKQMRDELLNELEKHLKRRDTHSLRELSIRLLPGCMDWETEFEAKVALIAYVLSKMLTKISMRKSKEFNAFLKKVETKLEEAKSREHALGELIDYLWETDREEGAYSTNLVDKAKAKLAAKLYSYGISLSKASDYFDTQVEEVFRYVAKTKTHEETGGTKGLAERYLHAKKVFGEEKR